MSSSNSQKPLSKWHEEEPIPNPMPLSQQAAEYLDKHQIWQLFSSLLSELAIQQPSDPRQYLIHKLDSQESHKLILLCNDEKLLNKACTIIQSKFETPLHRISSKSSNEEKDNTMKQLQKEDNFLLLGYPTCRSEALDLLEKRVIPDRVILLSNRKIDEIESDDTPIPLISLKNVFQTRSRIVCISQDSNIEEEMSRAIYSERINVDTSIAPKFPPRVCIIGPPGTGKSTVAMYLQKNLQLVYIHPRDVVDQHMKYHSKHGIEAEKCVKEQQCIKDDLVACMLSEDIADAKNDFLKKGWVLDDFPRTLNQAKLMTEHGVRPNRIIVLNASPSLLMDRCDKHKEIECDLIRTSNMKDSCDIGKSSPHEVLQGFQENIDGILEVLSEFGGVEKFVIADDEKSIQRTLELAYDFVIQPLPKASDQ